MIPYYDKIEFQTKRCTNAIAPNCINERQRVHSGSVYTFNYTEHIRIYPLKDSRRLRNSVKHWAYRRIRSSVTSFYPSVYRLFRHLDKRASLFDREHQESSGDLKSPLVSFLGRCSPMSNEMLLEDQGKEGQRLNRPDKSQNIYPSYTYFD